MFCFSALSSSTDSSAPLSVGTCWYYKLEEFGLLSTAGVTQTRHEHLTQSHFKNTGPVSFQRAGFYFCASKWQLQVGSWIQIPWQRQRIATNCHWSFPPAQAWLGTLASAQIKRQARRQGQFKQSFNVSFAAWPSRSVAIQFTLAPCLYTDHYSGCLLCLITVSDAWFAYISNIHNN